MIIQSSFKPAWWLSNSHLQTLFPALFRRPKLLQKPQRIQLQTPDQDELCLDCCGLESKGHLVILLHGLSGSSQSGYIQGLQQTFKNQGIRSIALNFRGCSGRPNRLARGYHSGDTGDIDFIYRYFRQLEPNTRIAVVGFSLGGNVLLKWLGEQASNIDICAAVAVSVPLLLDQCASKLDQGLSKIYRDRLMAELKDYIRQKQQFLAKTGNYSEMEKIAGVGDISKIKSFWQYDDQVVARLHGFSDVHEYYRLSSSRPFLAKINAPTLIVQARNDPFMTEAVIPQDNELSPHVTLELSHSGGHVGFVSGNIPFKPQYWLDQRITEYINQLLYQ